MKLTLPFYRGQIPRLGDQRLPDGFAQKAVNARLLSGDLEAWKALDPGAELAKSGAINTIHLMDREHWLHWVSSELGDDAVDVDVARGPILGDTTERTYFTGTDAPRVTNVSMAIGSCNEEYPCESLLLGVPAPGSVPGVDVTIPEAAEGQLLLDNPGAENGNTSGWTIVEGALVALQDADGGAITPSEGDFFFGGGAAASTVAIQRLDADNSAIVEGSTLRLTWDQNGDGTDTARMAIRFRDEDLELLSESVAEFTAETGGWQERELAGVIVPTDVAFVDVVQAYTREDGAEIAAYIDNIQLFRSETTNHFSGDTFNGWTQDGDGVFGENAPDLTVTTFGNEGGNMRISQSMGRPAPSFQLSSRKFAQVALHRDFQFTKSPKIEVEFDLYRGGTAFGIPSCVKIGVDANGAGPALYQGYNGEFRWQTASDWQVVQNSDIRVIPDAAIPTFEWLHFKITATSVRRNVYEVRVVITQIDSGTVLVDDSEEMEFLGDRLAFNQHAGDSNFWRTIYVDNITVQTAPSTSDPGRDLLESEFTSYVYTLVNQLGEEGAPSLASKSVQKSDASSVAVTTATTAPNDYGITHKRIYRAVTNIDGSQFLFVDEIPLAQEVFVDGTADSALGEPLQSQEWDLPPNNMRGIVALPNGIMMGFAENQVVPSVQNRPHAYPVGFRLATDYPIVGLGSIDTSAVVVTEAHPYLVQGSTPDTLSMQKLELPQGCVSKRSLVPIKGWGIIYASPDGLVGIAGTGQINLLTETIFARREWQALKPETIHAVAHDDRYFGWYDTGTVKRGFILDPMGREGFGLVELDFYAEAAFSDPLTDTLWLSIDGQLHAWDRGTGLLAYEWRSRLFQMPHPLSFAYVQVRAHEYTNLTVRVYADGNLVDARAVTSADEYVIPAVNAAREWEVEVLGTSAVQRIELVEDPEELV